MQLRSVRLSVCLFVTCYPHFLMSRGSRSAEAENLHPSESLSARDLNNNIQSQLSAERAKQDVEKIKTVSWSNDSVQALVCTTRLGKHTHFQWLRVISKKKAYKLLHQILIYHFLKSFNPGIDFKHLLKRLPLIPKSLKSSCKIKFSNFFITLLSEKSQPIIWKRWVIFHENWRY